MKAWFAKYKDTRARAERDPTILRGMAADFECVPPSQLIAGAARRKTSASPAPFGQRVNASDVSTFWRPTWLASPQSFEVPVVEDVQMRPQTMAEQLRSFRGKVDGSFSWAGKVLDEKETEFRAAAQAVLLSSGCKM